jgi:2-deoxy-D-gluconate 3-dehydrogenase
MRSPFDLTGSIGRRMVERGQGKIILTASMLSFQGGVNVVSYAAAQSGIAGVTRALANEWAGRGVNVNAIAPGYIATDNTKPLQDDPARSAGIVDRIRAGRWG